MLVMVVFFIAFRWIHLSTPLIRLFLLELILLLMPSLNFLPVWFRSEERRVGEVTGARRHVDRAGDSPEGQPGGVPARLPALSRGARRRDAREVLALSRSVLSRFLLAQRFACRASPEGFDFPMRKWIVALGTSLCALSLLADDRDGEAKFKEL